MKVYMLEDHWIGICGSYCVTCIAETKYQMMCIRWCARGLALGDAIKKVQVDMEVTENCLANKKRNM